MKGSLLITFCLIPFFSVSQIISQYIETNSGTKPKVIEVYNNTGSPITFSNSNNLSVWKFTNGSTNESRRVNITEGTLAVGAVMVIGSDTLEGGYNGVDYIPDGVTYVSYNFSFSGDDALVITLGNASSSDIDPTKITDTLGEYGNDPGWGWGSNYVTTANDNIELRPGIFYGDTDYWDSATDVFTRFQKVNDNPNDTSNNEYDIAGLGVPPSNNYIYDGSNWNSYSNTGSNPSTTSLSNTTPSFTNSNHILIGSGSINISTSPNSFETVQLDGGTLTIDAGKHLTVSGDLRNIGGSVILNSDVSAYSTLSVEGSMTGNLTYNRWVNDVSSASPSNADPGWDLVGSPVAGSSVSTSGLATNSGNVAMMEYNNSTNTWTNTSSSSVSTTVGKGYSMAMPQDNPGIVAFTGSLNSGNETISITNNNGSGSGTQWNLVSNPYAQFLAINSNAQSESSASSNLIWYNGTKTGNDILGHTDTEVGIWYWDGDSYVTISQSSAATYAAPGSAFFVSSAQSFASADGGDDTGLLDFRTGFMVKASDSALSDTNDWIGNIMDEYRAELFLEISQLEFRENSEIYFIENVTDGLDSGYDVRRFPNGNNTVNIYSRLVDADEGVDLGNQSLAYTEMWDKMIPIGVNALGGEEMTISISHRTTPADLNIYLEDNLESTMTNLLEEDFVLTPMSDLNGAGRFFIHMTADTMSNEEVSTSMLNAYKEVNVNYITLEGLATQSNNINVSLYNILGKKVLSTTLNNNMNTQTISTLGMASGVYVIELESGTDRLTKKLIIQ
tara:strand:+ start:767 stop:3124 length:2358 start_codon:yes stop_codon:yes gene_type:complete